MKKLASLLSLFSIGLFAAGCTEPGPEPLPPEEPAAVESGSGLGGDSGTIEEDMADEDTPPVTDEAPPETPEPGPENATDAPETTTEDAAANESATQAAEGSDAAEPAPDEGENNPQ